MIIVRSWHCLVFEDIALGTPKKVKLYANFYGYVLRGKVTYQY